ncbi:MAG: SRPBCC domain-containing protein [Chloroherpetonaceae bacterium]|nr:SRPBCC domain-containing protein [Chloroherpetonaceae bacterium]
MNNTISVDVTVNQPREAVWRCWTLPEFICQWNQASEDWHTPKAINDFRIGGKFIYTMASKDGAESFDFEGIYTEIKPLELIRYEMLDGRKVEVKFLEQNGRTTLIETFDPETENPVELQKQGWQSILESFKKVAELC